MAALFALVGTVMKRPLVVGLVFAFGWEQFALLMPGYLRRFTLTYYLQSLVPHAMPSEGVSSLLQAVFSGHPFGGDLPGVPGRGHRGVAGAGGPGGGTARIRAGAVEAGLCVEAGLPEPPEIRLRPLGTHASGAVSYSQLGAVSMTKRTRLFRGDFGRNSHRRPWHGPSGLLHGHSEPHAHWREWARTSSTYVPSDARMRRLCQRAGVMDSEVRRKLTEFHPGADNADRFQEQTGIDIETGHRLRGRRRDALR